MNESRLSLIGDILLYTPRPVIERIEGMCKRKRERTTRSLPGDAWPLGSGSNGDPLIGTEFSEVHSDGGAIRSLVTMSTCK